MKTIFILSLLLFSALTTASGAGITSVSPGEAAPGATVQVTMTIDSSATPAPPPSNVLPTSMALGDIVVTTVSRSGYDCTATFTLPGEATPGAVTCTITFAPPPTNPTGPDIVYTLAGGFTVTVPARTPPTVTMDPVARVVLEGDPASFSVTATGSEPLRYQWQRNGVDVPGATSASYLIASVDQTLVGAYRCVVSNDFGSDTSAVASLTISTGPARPYAIVDTGQVKFYDNASETGAPAPGETFYGQDASYTHNAPAYSLSADGRTVYDLHTGLTWTQSHDWNHDGQLTASDKFTQSAAVAYAATLNSQNYGGFSDWRLPSMKELYSLMNFTGTDPSGASDVTTFQPFIDTAYFTIGPGDESAGERFIDSQFATTSIYVDYVFTNQQAMFGLNLVDGRIKGYPLTGTSYYALYCRGNPDYGTNDFVDNGDGTVTDRATGLMWQQGDSGTGLDWAGALAYAENATLAGYSDWRLPNAKELQSIVDYSRSPSTTASAALDPVFSATPITNLAGQADFPWYWSGTTHVKNTGAGDAAVYVCFGRGTGSMDGVNVIDVHGAGCQRSDPKTGSAADYPVITDSPQGDIARVFNHVRLVRNVVVPESVRLSLEVTGPNAVLLSWTGESGLFNILQGTTTLDPTNWQNLTVIEASTPAHSFAHQFSGEVYFYRLIVTDQDPEE